MSKVSVIIPAFNKYNFTRKTLISIINQTYKEIEIWKLLQDSDRGKKNISIIKSLDISNLNLSMGDEIHFWFIAKDQNNSTKSNKFIGKFPTLEDLFTKIEEYEEDNNEWIDDIQESINEIYETTQETKLDIIKNKDLSIEKEKNIEESLNKVNDIFDELEKIQENIEKITVQKNLRAIATLREKIEVEKNYSKEHDQLSS